MKNKDLELLSIRFMNFKKHLDKIVNKDLEKYKINCVHFRPIMLLNNHIDGLSLNELTTFIGIDKANTTRVINDLLKKDIVYKETDKQRRYKIKLTETGKEIAFYATEDRRKTEEKIFSVLSEEEKTIFYSLVNKILESLEDTEEKK